MNNMPITASKPVVTGGARKKGTVLKEFWKNRMLLVMLLPGLVVLFINCYLPMGGIVMAFQRVNFHKFVFLSDWVGLKNFNVFFHSSYAGVITRNTILYNLSFIICGTLIALFFAIALNLLTTPLLSKFYQTVMFLPYFMSWVVITYLVVAMLSVDHGYFNTAILPLFHKAGINWYMQPQYWPFILVLLNIWKGAGYGSVMYLASIINIDPSYYEAARIDGATTWQQIKSITLPMLKPMVIILTLLSIGHIFNTDIGLFYTVPMNQGSLIRVTNTLDTYVYRTMVSGSVTSINLAAAAGLFQSTVGFACVMLTNFIVRKIEQDYALF